MFLGKSAFLSAKMSYIFLKRTCAQTVDNKSLHRRSRALKQALTELGSGQHFEVVYL